MWSGGQATSLLLLLVKGLVLVLGVGEKIVDAENVRVVLVLPKKTRTMAVDIEFGVMSGLVWGRSHQHVRCGFYF